MKEFTPRLSEAEDLVSTLRASLAQQEEHRRFTLVLNPVENFPFPSDLAVTAGTLHGLYNTDKLRSRDEQLETDMQFAGRSSIARDSRLAYSAWASALGADDATLRLLSGLQAHAVLFMSIARPGQRVLQLPVAAGGHVVGSKLLERLGLEVEQMVCDEANMCIDMDRTLAQCANHPPDFIFVDRSEGLVVEDFSPLTQLDAVSIFDASQYLSNIITGDHPNPFTAGFDIIVSSVHKNFPGPQKALLATRQAGDTWRELLRGVSTYVSNMHVASTYAATLTLGRTDWLMTYSKRMLSCAVLLEQQLIENGVPAVPRQTSAVPTHHVWIQEGSRRRAFETFEALERCGILTNYRKLPYSLGFGVRLGLSAAVRIGLLETDVPKLAALIAAIRRAGPTAVLQRAARNFNEKVWEQGSAN